MRRMLLDSPRRYSESDVNGPEFDRPPFEGVARKLFICSSPRSGSYMLCRYLIAAGLGVPHEYFNPIVMRPIAERLGFGETVRGLKWAWRGRLARLMQPTSAEEIFLGSFIPELQRRRTAGGVFAAKIHYGQYERVLDNRVGHALLQGGVFVNLVRDDLLGQAISFHVSNLTGRWSIDDAVTTAPAREPNYFDRDAITACINGLADEDRGWRVFFARHGIRPLFLSYESFRRDPWRDIDAIARALGIDPATLPHDYVEPDMPAEFPPDVPDRRKIRAHFLQREGRIVSGEQTG